MRQLAVIGDQQQPGGVESEPPYRKCALGQIGKQVEYGLIKPDIVGADHPLRLVEHQVEEPLVADLFTVYADLIPFLVDLCATFQDDLPIYAHGRAADQLLDFLAGAKALIGQKAVKPHHGFSASAASSDRHGRSTAGSAGYRSR